MTLVPGIHVAEDELDYEPSRALSVTLSGGMPTQQERTFDVLRVTIQARDITASQSDELMAQVDDLIMGIIPPTVIGTRRVTAIDYAGGPPASFGQDEEDRRVLGCAYLITAARSVH